MTTSDERIKNKGAFTARTSKRIAGEFVAAATLEHIAVAILGKAQRLRRYCKN